MSLDHLTYVCAFVTKVWTWLSAETVFRFAGLCGNAKLLDCNVNRMSVPAAVLVRTNVMCVAAQCRAADRLQAKQKTQRVGKSIASWAHVRRDTKTERKLSRDGGWCVVTWDQWMFSSFTAGMFACTNTIAAPLAAAVLPSMHICIVTWIQRHSIASVSAATALTQARTRLWKSKAVHPTSSTINNIYLLEKWILNKNAFRIDA